MPNPYVVLVRVYDSSSVALGSINVTGRVNSTNERHTLTTNSNGEVVFNLGDLSQFPSGFTVGDTFSYSVIYTSQEGQGSFTIDSGGGKQVTLTLTDLGEAPTLRYFTPQDFYTYFNVPIF